MAPNAQTGGPSPKLRTFVLAVITTLWAGSVVGQMFSLVSPPTGLNEVFTGVVMYLFAKDQQGRKREDNEDA